MIWEKITGHEKIKEKLKESIANERVSHAQLFSGNNGWGALSLAIAYAGEILASEKGDAIKQKVSSLQHPDIHFTFPVTSTEKIKTPTSNQFFKDWREFILENPYGSLYDWLEFNEVEKKQGAINVHEAQEIVKFLSLNSYEGSYKFNIIWLPEMMNDATANKLLKVLEEPPKKTIFLLVTEREDLLLPTILSRCQLVKLNRLSDEEVAEFLIETKGLNEVDAKRIALSSNGNLDLAIKNIEAANEEFEAYFVQWVRNAFMAAKNPSVLKNLVSWSNELSGWPREKQKQFLSYCSEIFRQALLKTYQANDLVFMQLGAEGFNWDKFTPFIHGANIEELLAEINESTYHIERNANAKIVLLDLSIKLTRHIHKKPV
jgi:DNA polymerase-3 subunit delta'